MPRQARVVVPGLAHHITQRGNNRQDVFFVDDDRVAYLDVLRAQCYKHGVRVLGYCRMTNHVHRVHALLPRELSLKNLQMLELRGHHSAVPELPLVIRRPG